MCQPTVYQLFELVAVVMSTPEIQTIGSHSNNPQTVLPQQTQSIHQLWQTLSKSGFTPGQTDFGDSLRYKQ